MFVRGGFSFLWMFVTRASIVLLVACMGWHRMAAETANKALISPTSNQKAPLPSNNKPVREDSVEGRSFIPSYCLVAEDRQLGAAKGWLENSTGTAILADSSLLYEFDSFLRSEGGAQDSLGVSYRVGGSEDDFDWLQPRNMTVVFLHSGLFLSENGVLNLFQSAIRSLFRPEDLFRDQFSTVATAVPSGEPSRRKLLVVFAVGSNSYLDRLIRVYFDQALQIVLKLCSFTTPSVLQSKIPIGSLTEAVELVVIRSPSFDELPSVRSQFASIIANSNIHRINVSEYVANNVRSAGNMKPTNPLESIGQRFATLLPWNSRSVPLVSKPADALKCQTEVMRIIEDIRNDTNTNISRLQGRYSRNYFTEFVSFHLQRAKHKFKLYCIENKIEKRISLIFDAQLQSSFLEMLLPLYQKQLQILKSEVLDALNAAIERDAETFHTTSIDEFIDYRNQALAITREELEKMLPPRVVPSNNGVAFSAWNAEFELLLMKRTIDEFIHNKKIEYQTSGVLPRHRKPILLSFHTLFVHPFGRDYRQESIGYNTDDKLVFNNRYRSMKGNPYIVSAKQARAVLEPMQPVRDSIPHRIVDTVRAIFNFNKMGDNYIFTREMAMLPLSIKNPGPNSVTTVARKLPPDYDRKRKLTGPERFIDWSLAPLDAVKANAPRHLISFLNW